MHATAITLYKLNSRCLHFFARDESDEPICDGSGSMSLFRSADVPQPREGVIDPALAADPWLKAVPLVYKPGTDGEWTASVVHLFDPLAGDDYILQVHIVGLDGRVCHREIPAEVRVADSDQL